MRFNMPCDEIWSHRIQRTYEMRLDFGNNENGLMFTNLFPYLRRSYGVPLFDMV